MVSNNLLFYVHLRLNEIFGTVNDKPFLGISVITIGDFFQLPPVGERPVYADYKNNWQNFESLWKLFKIFELTEVMRQRGNAEFIHLMNNVRIGDTQSCDIRLSESRVIKPQSSSYPQNTLHIFVEIASAKRHNLEMLYSIEGNIFTIPAKDQFPKSIPRQKIIEVLNPSQSETGGLAGVLDIKLNARVMSTVNIDLQDRLVNVQLGTVKCIRKDSERNVSKIYVKFDDSKASLKRMNSGAFLENNICWCLFRKEKLISKLNQVKLLHQL